MALLLASSDPGSAGRVPDQRSGARVPPMPISWPPASASPRSRRHASTCHEGTHPIRAASSASRNRPLARSRSSLACTPPICGRQPVPLQDHVGTLPHATKVRTPSVLLHQLREIDRLLEVAHPWLVRLYDRLRVL